MVDFKAIGISYHNAPLKVREEVTLNEKESAEFLLKLRDTLDLQEVLIVSTCNRTEIYYSSNKELGTKIISLLSVQKSMKSEVLDSYFKKYTTKEAINHLFEVSLGMDSQVLGDIQISNQIKRAYQLSADNEMAGPFLHRLMHTVFFANKRVVQETRLQDGNASVASVAAELIKRFIENVADPKIAIIGLGEIGQNVLENLGEIETPICLVNRTKSTAEGLAKSENVTVRDFAERDSVIKENDVIISAVGSGTDVIEKSQFESDKFQNKLCIDLSVPRSISQNVEELEGISLYNVDQLSVRTEKAKKIRESSIPEAKVVIAEAIAGFNDWKDEMEVSPTIQKLKKTLNEIRKQELARHIGKVSDDEMALLEVVTKNMIQKVIKLPVLQLKAACKRGESENLVGVLNDLFNLDPDEVKRD